VADDGSLLEWQPSNKALKLTRSACERTRRPSQLIAVFSGRHWRGKGPSVRQLLLIVLGLLVVASEHSLAAPGAEGKMGSICLVPVAAPNNENKSLANPTGGNPEADYAVQLDARPAVRVKVFSQPRVLSTKQWIRDYPEGTLLSSVAVGTRHKIVVHHKGTVATGTFGKPTK